ncbi:uncharacterized protein LOC136093750 [Hydra vulgaris]|uniref:uncharacterized protein LOC136093750 n=1 Tax=Hydra vulgaris TaxID=6087 RepID=UPI0032EA3654
MGYLKKSISTGDVPNLWKKSNITTIFKKRSKLQPSNYRPISLTSVVCKVIESLIHDCVKKFCTKHNLISKALHGFVSKRECVTNLLEAHDILTQSMFPADVIYTNFAKAFDKVPHRRLLHKLQAYGISETLLKWVKNWLTNSCTLEETIVEQELGVIVSNDLKVKTQVETAVSIANQMFNCLRKAFCSCRLVLWKTLYLAYICPHLDFAVQVWSPHLKNKIVMMEKVQRQVTKKISEIKHLPYEERLQKLKLTSLEDRRNRVLKYVGLLYCFIFR